MKKSQYSDSQILAILKQASRALRYRYCAGNMA